MSIPKLLILGGTTEAMNLCRTLAGRNDIDPMLSLAGRTAHPLTPPIPFRIGGFGGVEGLAAYLQAERIGALVDATHPFASRIKQNAVEACAFARVPIAAFTRPPWTADSGDHWIAVPDVAAAVTGLGTTPKRVFLTTGRLEVERFRAAPHHHYLIRTIDPPDPESLPPNCTVLQARGPFSAESERQLMMAERIDILVTKNSGGAATDGKLAAARALSLPVVMVQRPEAPHRPTFHDRAAILDWIASTMDLP